MYKFIKHTLNKCFDSKDDQHIALFANMYDPPGARTPQPCNYAISLPNQRHDVNY